MVDDEWSGCGIKISSYCSTQSQGCLSWTNKTEESFALRDVDDDDNDEEKTTNRRRWGESTKIIINFCQRRRWGIIMLSQCIFSVWVCVTQRLGLSAKDELRERAWTERSSHANSRVRQTFRANFTTFLEFTLKWLSIKFTSWFGASLYVNGVYSLIRALRHVCSDTDAQACWFKYQQ